MLPLNSPDWAKFDTYSGSGDELPSRLSAWKKAVGTTDEEGEWGWLRDQFLCQSTIKNSAIVIVPHICTILPATPATSRNRYAIDLGQVHMAWREKPIPFVPVDLVASYESSVVSIRAWACECLTRPADAMEFRYLLSACTALCDHASLGKFLFSFNLPSSDYPDLSGYL